MGLGSAFPFLGGGFLGTPAEARPSEPPRNVQPYLRESWSHGLGGVLLRGCRFTFDLFCLVGECHADPVPSAPERRGRGHRALYIRGGQGGEQKPRPLGTVCT